MHEEGETAISTRPRTSPRQLDVRAGQKNGPRRATLTYGPRAWEVAKKTARFPVLYAIALSRDSLKVG